MQSSSGGADQRLAATVGMGVDSLCDCGFSSSNLHQIVLQCFPDDPAKINVLLLLQATPSRDTSEIVGFLNTWIASGPQIVLDERNTSVRVNSQCDITVIQGSECAMKTQTPPTPSTSGPSDPTGSGNSSEGTMPGVASPQQSNGKDLTVAGGVLLTFTIIGIAVTGIVVVVVLVRYRVIKVRSFSL